MFARLLSIASLAAAISQGISASAAHVLLDDLHLGESSPIGGTPSPNASSFPTATGETTYAVATQLSSERPFSTLRVIWEATAIRPYDLDFDDAGELTLVSTGGQTPPTVDMFLVTHQGQHRGAVSNLDVTFLPREVPVTASDQPFGFPFFPRFGDNFILDRQRFEATVVFPELSTDQPFWFVLSPRNDGILWSFDRYANPDGMLRMGQRDADDNILWASSNSGATPGTYAGSSIPLRITAIPEPSTAGFVLLLSAVIGRRRRSDIVKPDFPSQS